MFTMCHAVMNTGNDMENCHMPLMNQFLNYATTINI